MGVVRERAFEPRRVDELQAAKWPQLRQFHGNQVDLLDVLGVFLLGDVAADLVEGNLRIAAIPKTNARPIEGAVTEFRDHGGNRDDSNRKDAAPDEVVQEAALPGLEASQHGDADLVLNQEDARALARRPESAEITVARRHVRRQVETPLGCGRGE